MLAGNWNPWRELEALRREVERVLEGVGTDYRPFAPFRAAFLPGRAASAYPLLNIIDNKDDVCVEALAPGLDPGTLEISVVRNTLKLSGEKQALSEAIKPDAFHRNERSAGKFTRVIELPTEIDGEKVTADYKNGVLAIHLPKAEAAKPKQITVSVK